MNDEFNTPRGRRGGIAVGGFGSISVEPDIALLSVAVSVQDPSLAAAKEMVGAKATTARDHLLASGVDATDLQTTQLSVHTIRSHPEGQRQAAGDRSAIEFRVSTTLSAIFRHDLERAQTSIDGLFDVVGDGLELHGLSFDCSDPTEARREARRSAFADARSKAEQLAFLAGVELGSVRSIRENGFGSGPGPMGAGRALLAPEASVPVEGGQLAQSVEIHVRWGLDPSPDEG